MLSKKSGRMSELDRLIGTAESFLGITELPRGSNNVVFNTHYYGREVSGEAYPWCAVFIWDVFRLAGLSELFCGGDKTASCAAILSYARSSGQFVSPAELRRGDVVLYKFDRTNAAVNHTGLVIYAGSGSFYAIEGNTSVSSDSNGGAVMQRLRTCTNVVGAYRPHYMEEDTMTYWQFEQYMNRYLSITGTGEVCSVWAKNAINELKDRGIVSGSDGDFGWLKPATKETVAQMLYNYIQKLEG